MDVKDTPGTLQGGGAPFITTQWSVVVAAGAQNEAQAQAALDQLCRDYWPPLYSFVRRRRYSAADAQDLVQGFFAHLLAQRTYAYADPARGRFRAFLLGAFKNYLADEWTREHRQKRGGGLQFVLLDEEIAAVEAACARESSAWGALDEEQLFERRWAAALASGAMRRLTDKYGGGPKARVFQALRPYLTGEDAANLPAQDELATRLGLPVETLRSYLSRMRARYRQFLREEVARTVAKAEDVDQEMRHLRRVLVNGVE